MSIRGSIPAAKFAGAARVWGITLAQNTRDEKPREWHRYAC